MVLEFFGDFSFARIYELSLNLKCAPLREGERVGGREGREGDGERGVPAVSCYAAS